MSSKQLILVTGINGFLGAHIVDQLVKAGYRVRGTVRSGKLEPTRQSNAIYGNDVEVTAIDDLAFGDFTDALRGVDGVIHAAAPLVGRDSPEAALRASIEGALNILRQTEKAGIKRFVLVSSIVTVKPIGDSSPIYTEDDWVETSKEKALASQDPIFVYVSEKVLAERAVWEFAEKHPHIDITSVNPPFFLGPFAPNFRFSDSPSINEISTNSLVWLLLKPDQKPYAPLMLTIDVRDVARATVHALTSPPTSEVGRKRLLFLPHVVSWKDAAEYVAQARPELRDRISKAALTEFGPAPPKGPVDNSRAVELLKMGELNDWKSTLLATVDALVEIEQKLAKEGKAFQ